MYALAALSELVRLSLLNSAPLADSLGEMPSSEVEIEEALGASTERDMADSSVERSIVLENGVVPYEGAEGLLAFLKVLSARSLSGALGFRGYNHVKS